MDDTTRILVSTNAPFQVLSVISLAQSKVGLGIDAVELLGQNVVDIIDSCSDKSVLQNAIVASENGQQSKIQLTFSGVNGKVQNMMVNCSPYQTEDFRICCHIALNRSFAVSLHEAFQESSCPRALISSESPHVVHMINHHFAEKFGIIKSEILGRPLGLFHDHLTASKWVALFRSALNGRIVRDLLNISTMSPTLQEDTILVPVSEGASRTIKNILVLFAPSTPIQPLATVAAVPRVANPSTTTCQAEVSSMSEANSSIPLIRPRRKLYASDPAAIPPSPVAVTPELVRTLSGMSLTGAAAAAGVSPTAFKKACRKIGIRRWTYRRNDGQARPQRARGEPQSAAAAVPALTLPSEPNPWMFAPPAQRGAGLDLDRSNAGSANEWAGLCASAFPCAPPHGGWPALGDGCGGECEGDSLDWAHLWQQALDVQNCDVCEPH